MPSQAAFTAQHGHQTGHEESNRGGQRVDGKPTESCHQRDQLIPFDVGGAARSSAQTPAVRARISSAIALALTVDRP